MDLSPEKQLAIDDQAARNDWSSERIEMAKRQAELTETGASELAHVEQQQHVADVEVQKGLGLTAAQSLEIDAAAAQGDWDQERIEKVKAAVAASSSHEQ